MTNNQGKNRLLHWALGVFFLIVALAAIFGVTQYRDIPLVVSETTTIVTQPLDADGNVDYMRAFEEKAYSDEIATEKNGFRFLFQSVDFSSELPESLFPVVCKQLELDPATTKPTIKNTDPYTFAIEYVNSPDADVEFIRQLVRSQRNEAPKETEAAWTQIEKADGMEMLVARSVTPWTAKDLPMLVDWVEKNSPALDQYALAVRMPNFEVPISRASDDELMIGTLMPYVQEFRSIARGYLSRANYYLGQGEIRKAMDDVISCKRLGRHARNSHATVERLVGVAIESIADSIGITNVTGKQATKEDLRYFLNEMKALPPVSRLDNNLLFEKLASLEILQRLATSDEKQPFKEVEELTKLRSLGLDWNVVVQEFNQTFDANWEGNNRRSKEDDEFLTAIEFFSRGARSRRFAHLFAGLTFVSREVVAESDNRVGCADNLRRITIAMLLYEKDHGTLPPAFSADKAGNPLHSWRVLLLPYLGEQELFDKIRLDEPWNSEHNSKFAELRPAVFACPSCQKCGKQNTSYSVVVGSDLPFEGHQGKQLAAFGPDSDDMMLVAERVTPVNWLDPTHEIKQEEAEQGINFLFENDKQPAVLGSEHNRGSQFGFRNGAAVFISQDHDVSTFKAQLKGTNQKFVPWR